MVKRKDNAVKDPVCGMEVETDQFRLTYLQMELAFCSLHCKTRFLAHPHLYIGYPGQPAPVPEGRTLLKRRRLLLARPLSAEGTRIVEEMLYASMGIREVSISDTALEITYDLLQVSVEDIGRTLFEAGVRLGEGWSERLKRAFIAEAEEWELTSLEVTPRHFPDG